MVRYNRTPIFLGNCGLAARNPPPVSFLKHQKGNGRGRSREKMLGRQNDLRSFCGEYGSGANRCPLNLIVSYRVRYTRTLEGVYRRKLMAWTQRRSAYRKASATGRGDFLSDALKRKWGRIPWGKSAQIESGAVITIDLDVIVGDIAAPAGALGSALTHGDVDLDIVLGQNLLRQIFVKV